MISAGESYFSAQLFPDSASARTMPLNVEGGSLIRNTMVLLRLIDQAIAIAQERLMAKRAGISDPASEEGLAQIISGLRYRRGEAISSGFPMYDSYMTLGLARAVLEIDMPD